MTEFRFFGRFNPRLGTAVPGLKNAEEVDETEARRRYHDPKSILDLVPPIDAETGAVPYKITVTTASEPSFNVLQYTADGLPELELHWENIGDGRLFLGRVVLRAFDLKPWTSIVPRAPRDWDSQVILTIKTDGRGFLQINERGAAQFQTAETTIDTDLAYRPVPAWGEWDALIEEPGFLDQMQPS